MSFTGQNPRFRSTILTDIGVASIANPASGSHRLINRAGALFVQDPAGLETGIGAGGTVDKVTQVGHTFDEGEILYYTGSAYARALANAANTSEIVGMVSRVIDADTFEVTLEGKVTGLTGLTAGEVYFLSPITAGAITITEPTVLGHVSLPVGVAISTTVIYVRSSRGAVVGSSNARTEIALGNNAVSNVQSVAAYQAGELTGWVEIDGTTDLKFYVSAPFSKNGAGSDYNISPQYVGDTPPVGFSMSVTSGGIIQATLPSIAGYVSAKINFALNAPAVGATFPLSIDSTLVQFSTLKAKDSGGFVFQENGGTQIGSISDAGAWTFGVTSSFNEFSHTLNARSIDIPIAAGQQATYRLSLGASGGTYPSISYNAVPTSTAGEYLRTGAASEIATIFGLGAMSLAGSSFEFHAFASGGAGTLTPNSSSRIASATQSGAWTFGPSGFSGIHTINANQVTLTSPATGGGFNFNANGQSWQYGNIGSQVGGPGGTNSIFWYDATGTKFVGGISTDGVWTLGGTSGAISNRHLIRGGENSATGTGAPLNLLNNTGGVTWRVGPTNNNGFVVFNSSDVGLFVTNGANTWTSTSDLRAKKNVIDSSLGLNEIQQLRPIKYDYITDDSEDSKRVGFIAQELYDVIPHAAYKPENPDEMMGVSPTELIAVLVKAIQELSAKVTALEAK
jgi:hypothetical protein